MKILRSEFPNPQFRRDNWLCLNGEWEFCISKNSAFPGFFGEKITVPFPPQSLLSGIHRDIPEDNYLFYKKIFRLPKDFNRGKILLHFGNIFSMICKIDRDELLQELVI